MKKWISLVRFAIMISMGSGTAWASLPVVPVKAENTAAIDQAIGKPAQKVVPVEKPGNFGKIVSPEAKVWKSDPKPGYRNFGAWVSSQRRHKHDKKVKPTRPGADTPAPTLPTAPVPPSVPTGTSDTTSGSFGT